MENKKSAVIAVGGNMGDTEKYIKKALRKMDERGIEVERLSKLIVTKPYGVTDQDDFVNGACLVRTEKTPRELLRDLLEIELELDRKRTRHWGPRTIDLDIIYYEDAVIDEPDLVIPHPDMQNRDFVLIPLMELCPEKIHPVLGKTTAGLLAELENKN